MSIAYDIVATTVAATMVGNEFAVAAFIHPQLYRLDNRAHARTASLLAGILGKRMPLWYALALLLMLGAIWEHYRISSGLPLLILSAAIIWTIVIVGTVMVLVPINNRIARLDPEHRYEGWQDDRARWDRLHRIRVALLLISVLLLISGLFQGKMPFAF